MLCDIQRSDASIASSYGPNSGNRPRRKTESRQRLGTGDGKFARPITADEGNPPATLPAIQVRANLFVDVILLGQPGIRNIQSGRAFRGRFAVVGVEVPPGTGRLRSLHQHVESPARVAVEILQQQTALGLRPMSECRFIGGESASRQHSDRRLSTDEPVGGQEVGRHTVMSSRA